MVHNPYFECYRPISERLEEDRIQYTAAVARAAEKRRWAFAYWQFDSNFVVYDIDRGAWNTPVYRALVPVH